MRTGLKGRGSTTATTIFTRYYSFYLLLQSNFKIRVIELNLRPLGSTINSTSNLKKRLAAAAGRGVEPFFRFFPTTSCWYSDATAKVIPSRHGHIQLAQLRKHLKSEQRSDRMNPLPRKIPLSALPATSSIYLAKFSPHHNDNLGLLQVVNNSLIRLRDHTSPGLATQFLTNSGSNSQGRCQHINTITSGKVRLREHR